jgi:SnoaL-like domain
MTDNNATNLIDGYIAAWNTTDSDARAKKIAEVFAEQVEYTDPLASVHGHEELSALIADAQAQFAGLTFRLAGAPDAHHDVVRFTWELAAGDGEALVIGSDVALIAPDGRIGAVAGFLDKVPAV